MISIRKTKRPYGAYAHRRNNQQQKLNSYILFCVVGLTILAFSIVLSKKKPSHADIKDKHVEFKYDHITNRINSYEKYVKIS